jgi:excinuclease ABC subunit A
VLSDHDSIAAVPTDAICIHGAREHNLKNLELRLPHGKFVVITGVSGSGKSTLAFDLIFAEGQRRFLDSMNTYARQFVDQMARPDVDLITGIPPTVSIEQRNSRGGGKSTVATVTEIFHFIRLLYARLGTPFCPECQEPVLPQTGDALLRRLREEAQKRGDLLLLAPVVRGRKGFHTEVGEWAARHGYDEVRADGVILPTGDRLRLDRFREHDIEIVTGVFDGDGPTGRKRKGRRSRTAATAAEARELVEQTLTVGKGTLFALDNHRRLTVHSTERACPGCGRSLAPLDPKLFSYNSAAGWCPKCRGFGELFYLPKGVDRGAREEAIEESWFGWAEGQREPCPECEGARLNAVARAVRLILPGQRQGPRIEELSGQSVVAAMRFFGGLRPRGRAGLIARDILPEILERLRFLDEVGLGYLELGRSVTTLSGGEAQRIRLAAQLGSNLSGVLYVLDEPTIGLHARDNAQLLAALGKLRSRGNTVVVVEHDEETMRQADHIIDLGPGAGVNGGEVVAQGTLADLMKNPESITGRALRERPKHPARGERRPVGAKTKIRRTKSKGRASGGQGSVEPNVASETVSRISDSLPAWLALKGADANNLKDLTVHFPLGRFVAVTGVSGSGKSTLIRECLLPALKHALEAKQRSGGGGPQVSGHESLKALYEVDQSPIGRTPRSTPATYVGFFDEIRRLFAALPEARLRGYSPGRFSFNSPEGRCAECDGAGLVKLEMNFLPPAFVTCESCRGLRFGRETLDIEYHGRSVAQVLDLSVAEAREFFAAVPRVRRALDALHDTGLDYLKLGQTSPTLSGGEAQRVKLVSHLLTGLKPGTDRPGGSGRRSLFVLEEPTIGLHASDVRRLVEVLQRLVDAGHSVIVIEHNLDLIAEADWVIDLGPESGAAGGRIVVEGPPEKVARCRRSHTGKWLRKSGVSP